VDYVAGYGFQFGIVEILIGLVVLAVVVFTIWKLAKLLWAASSN
jgi:hypothetical protein